MSDIATTRRFSPGETNIDDAKLNDIIDSASIQTSFHTGKGTISAPSKATVEAMVYDTAAGAYKRCSLDTLIFSHAELITNRTAKTTPVGTETALISDSGTYKQITLVNALFGAAAHTAPVTADKLPIYDSAGTAQKSVTLATLIHGATAKTAAALGDELAIYDLAGTAYKKSTVQGLFDGACGTLATKATPKDNDLATIYDVTGAAAKAATLQSLGIVYRGVDAGATDDYAIAAQVTPAAYFTGMVVLFQAATANSGVATLNVNGLGAKTLKKGSANLATGDIAAGQWVTVVYDGTAFQILPAPRWGNSGNVAIPATNNAATAAHNCGAVPSAFRWVLVLTSGPEAGFSTGDEVALESFFNTASGGQNFNAWADASNVGVSYVSTNIGTYPKGGGAAVGITPANWRLKCYWQA